MQDIESLIVIVAVSVLLFSQRLFLNRLDKSINRLIKEIERTQDSSDSETNKSSKSFSVSHDLETFCFIGIGGGGCNLLDGIFNIDQRHRYIYIDSDRQALESRRSNNRILLTNDKRSGLGCGGDMRCGAKMVSEASKEKIMAFTEPFDKIYVVVTLGGGVGSGASGKIVSFLRSIGKEVEVFAILPFGFEGKVRNDNAEKAMHLLRESNNQITILENNALLNPDEGYSLGITEVLLMYSGVIHKRTVGKVN